MFSAVTKYNKVLSYNKEVALVLYGLNGFYKGFIFY